VRAPGRCAEARPLQTSLDRLNLTGDHSLQSATRRSWTVSARRVSAASIELARSRDRGADSRDARQAGRTGSRAALRDLRLGRRLLRKGVKNDCARTDGRQGRLTGLIDRLVPLKSPLPAIRPLLARDQLTARFSDWFVRQPRRAPKAGPRHALARASDGESSRDAVVSLSTDVMGARRIAMALRGLLGRNRWRRALLFGETSGARCPRREFHRRRGRVPLLHHNKGHMGRLDGSAPDTSSRTARRAEAHPGHVSRLALDDFVHEMGPNRGSFATSALLWLFEWQNPEPLIGAPNARTPALAGVLGVELGGLEPPTSWVRSRRALALSLACCRVFAAVEARTEARISGQFRPISAGIGPKERGFGPISRLAELRLPVGRPLHTSGR
jgi:hypothetical protein